MRLINVDSLELEEFVGVHIPGYVILSHTWDDGEVLFRDWGQPEAALKKGYAKILKTCEWARGYGVSYAWVDTCCIDKSSSAELTEAINSMFAWYSGAVVCLAYLSDLEPGEFASRGFGHCRWFTRGWTLQELIAPRQVLFCDNSWKCVGTSQSLSPII
ncbi:hypothetical protein NKR23_g3695 [Pleurostoma richardsiae]|uniref:Heterokaryon incompatibility domain-containing protein n=1 Tax=Pleurostoma richardsiae TaxID=41990 RepID=A0AA38RYC6_9PEZI|nr:hypothetical protein NKR23_g3695 [Pleurostoma richardsiae]